ncbi:heat-inducible transcription repressor [Rhynchospora pubera]|uniref:Heat-inducible transcription repressor n=1 Tax=Rhynchospora pubera TaxID=906938 RepID=A0AAV8HQ94_9POAL|nr:heat-inducible transcription repressor [Rhynchospora pubera]
MAYRRKQVMTRSATFVDDYRSYRDRTDGDDSSTSSLAAQAIRASALHRDSSLSSAYADNAITASSDRRSNQSQVKDDNSHEGKNGLWGVLAIKAKNMLDEENPQKDKESSPTVNSTQKTFIEAYFGCMFFNILPSQSRWSYERLKKQENPAFQKGSEALKDIGGKIKNALEGGLTMVENRTADIIQETKKLQIRRKGSQNVDLFLGEPKSPAEQDNQLKASRDLANAMAAKAKLLLRELKTVKSDLAFAKLRCSQLEEENKVLREGREKGKTSEDEDLIRLQLETLLAEKARLAHENSVYARENRFLREIVEFHQFNSDDVVSLQGDFEEDNDDDIDLELPSHFHETTYFQPTTVIKSEESELDSHINVNSSDPCDGETPVVEKEEPSPSPVLLA